MTTPAGVKGLSLVEYARELRRADCKVCKLPAEVLAQIRGAREKRIARPVILRWLEDEQGQKITVQDLEAHTNGRHDS